MQNVIIIFFFLFMESIPLFAVAQVKSNTQKSLKLTTPYSALQAQPLVMGTINTIDGNQLNPNTFSSNGNYQGFASALYYYMLTRSGDFTSANLAITVDQSYWLPGVSHKMLIINGPHNYHINGVIPHNVDCGETETIVMDIYNLANQLVQSTTFIIRNPLQPDPFSNFKIFGSTATYPNVIQACGSQSKNVLLDNLKLQYTGTGFVWKYAVSITEVNSFGYPVSGGYTFNLWNGNPGSLIWINGPVPATVNVNTGLVGTITGHVPSYWGYYLITLQTIGGPCVGGYGLHTALIHLNPEQCRK